MEYGHVQAVNQAISVEQVPRGERAYYLYNEPEMKGRQKMWIAFCWLHEQWFKTSKGVRWHRRRWECDEYVERVSKTVSRELKGMTREEVNDYGPPT